MARCSLTGERVTIFGQPAPNHMQLELRVHFIQCYITSCGLSERVPYLGRLNTIQVLFPQELGQLVYIQA